MWLLKLEFGLKEEDTLPIKVLLINFPRDEIHWIPSNVEIAHYSSAKIALKPTLHDYHAIVLDVEEIPGEKWQSKTLTISEFGRWIRALKGQVCEQIETGGVTFCFSGAVHGIHKLIGEPACDNYSWCPVDIDVTSLSGDTFYPKFEELKYYTPLLKGLQEKAIFWSCYFSKLPENSKVLATNRAGYPVFAEIPIGLGKLVMLPRFKNRPEAVTRLVNQVLPQLIREEEPTFLPEWLSGFAAPIETKTRDLLREIETAKKLLYTKDKALKKAVAYALEKLGFNVKTLPDGTLPDLEVSTNGSNGVVEVKGHDKEQSDRKDVLQLLGYLSETETKVKGIFVSNHELRVDPNSRSKKAFTDGAIKLAVNNEICLLSSIDLWNVVLSVLEGETAREELRKIRNTVMTATGPTPLVS